MGIGTIFGFLLAIYFYAFEFRQDWPANVELLGIAFIAVASIFILAPILASAFFWSPLQIAEQTITPRISDLFFQDRRLRITRIVLLLFPLITVAFILDLFLIHFFSISIVLSLWFFLFGVSLDALYFLFQRITGYLDPFYVSQLFTKEATKAIQEDRELDLYKWVDALAEEGIWAVNRSSEGVCNQVCNEIQKTARVFLESSKVLPHVEESKEIPELGVADKVSYTLFYLLDHLEKINTKAANKGLEAICNHIVTSTGKIVISSAKYDISMASYPLFCLGKFSIEAQKKGMPNVGTKAIVTLVEVAKTILGEIDVTYLELQEPFKKLVDQIDEVTKEMFKQDKSLSVKFLIQPFLEIKALFESEKMRSHPDSEAIIQHINRALAEYTALEAILRTAPPRPVKEEK